MVGWGGGGGGVERACVCAYCVFVCYGDGGRG